MILPIWFKPALAAAILAVIAGLGWFVYDSIDSRGYNRAKSEYEQAAEHERIAHQEEIDGLAKSFAIKSAQQRLITQTIIKEVDKYVPNTLPMLPAGFRVLHDAAAAGKAPVDPAGTNAAPVAPSAVAATLASNYANCRYDQERLEALQAIVRTINGGDDGKVEKD
jgi:hypothetical protein